MSDAALHSALRRLLSAAGLPEHAPQPKVVRLAGGSNNRVYAVTVGPERMVLKAYFPDAHPRLRAEFSFLQFARQCGVDAVPEPLARDDQTGMGLYQLLPGRPMSIADVDGDAVEAAASLFATVNRRRDRARQRDIPPAAEACFSLGEHLERVENRVQQLAGLPAADETDAQALAFVRDRLQPEWARAKRRTDELAGSSGHDPRQAVPDAERCVSPSDFGFHNALIDSGGHISFLDFEYAGWDDPAKLVCDFFCQVAVPAPPELLARFQELALAPFADPEPIARRITLLRPIYRVKWACIVLNDFLTHGRARRGYALGADHERERRASQLDKAAAVLDARG